MCIIMKITKFLKFKELPENNSETEPCPMNIVMDYMQKRMDKIDETRRSFKAQYPDLLPDDNLQKTEEVQVNEKSNLVDFERGEVNEVERVLGKLKNEIASFRINFDMKCRTMRYLPDAAQNLVNALEAERRG